MILFIVLDDLGFPYEKERDKSLALSTHNVGIDLNQGFISNMLFKNK